MKLLHKKKNGKRVPARYWLRPCKPNELKDLIRLYEQNNQDLLDNQTLSVNLIHNIVPKRELKIMQQIDDEEEIPMTEKLKKRINPNLTPDNKEKLLKILNSHQGAFSKSANDMGFVKAKICPITIDIGSENVPYHQPYPLILAKRELMNKVINGLLEAKIIEESDAPGGAPALLVPRANGKDRLVIDYRSLNGLIKRKQYPMPRVDDYLEAMNGYKYFALLDLAQNYYQIELAPEERVKTVFVTPDGKYQYRRLPMGLAESPSYFQKLINTVIKDLKYSHCMGYFDDLPCMGKTFETFCTCLELLLIQLEKYNLKARIEKCSFGQTELEFL